VIVLTGHKVYADLTLIINLLMDAVILWAAAKLAGFKFSYTRIFFTAMLGAIYAVGYLFYPMNIFYSFPLKIIFSCFLILLAFYPQSWKDLKRAFQYFYLINFIAAGAITGFASLTAGMKHINNISILWLLMGVIIVIGLGKWGQKYLVNRIIPQLLNYMVEIKFNGHQCSGSGFLDTGNMLRDPLTNRPVLIAEYAWLKNFLPLDLIEFFETGSSETEILSFAANSTWADRVRVIPFSSIGRHNGLLLGFRADEINVSLGDRNICHKNLIVAVYRSKLCQDGHYQMLVPAEILQSG
jgi:stage II sporulation protein GA (sporulation sigma-E factor processing peptidase)